jgi:hypothetical protein
VTPTTRAGQARIARRRGEEDRAEAFFPLRSTTNAAGYVRDPRDAERLSYTWRRLSIASVISAIAASSGTPLFRLRSRYRKDTAPAAASSPPAMRM